MASTSIRVEPLAPGQFYSSIAQRRTQQLGYALSDLSQKQARKLPVHSHELSYFFFVLDGYFEEADWRGVREFGPMSGGFNPSDTAHDGSVGPKGVRFFTIELKPDLLQGAGMKIPTCPIVDYGQRRMLWSGMRLFREFQAGTSGDQLTSDSLVCEMLADVSDYRDAEIDRAPTWLKRTCDRLNSLETVGDSIAELADEAGVHPIHLARVFRKVYRLTPGEYRQRARVRKACGGLLNSKLPIAEVAYDAGFSDQSHMTRIFQRIVGMSPGQFRLSVQ